MKKNLILFCILVICNLPLTSHAINNLQPLKVAIIQKNNNLPPYTSSRYIKYYKQGLYTAKSMAKTLGVSIRYKFFIMADLKEISQQMDRIKAWNPDFIIGPNYSNAFLLLKNYFKDILVLSAYANDQSLATLQKNFYTLNLLNDKYAQVISNYIIKDFPNADIHIIVDTSCKSCFTLSKLFSNVFQSRCPNRKISIFDADDLDINKISSLDAANNHLKNTVVLMLTTSDSAITLIPKIANHVKNTITFIGADSWGSSIDSELGRLKAKNSFALVHIVPWSLQLNTDELKLFKKNYETIYHQAPVDNITFAVFSTVDSVLHSIKNCQEGSDTNLQKKIFNCYQYQLKADPNAYKPVMLAVEDLTNNSLIRGISSEEKNYCHE